MVTVPVLWTAFAAKVRTLLALSSKSPAAAGDTASADTATVNAVSTACSTVAVTVLELEEPLSEIESGVSTSVTVGAESVRHTMTLSPSR